MATLPDRNRTIRTACDRCYELKERCARASITVACRRCDRLDLVCSTVRPKRPAGRRPRRREQSAAGTTSSLSSTLDVGTWLQDLTDLLPEERQLMMSLLCQPENLEYYVVSPSFQAAEQRSLVAPLPAALPVLKDAYLARAGTLKLLEPGVTTEECQSTSLQHISSAMEVLRSLPVLSSQDAALCLTLGTTLALFVYSAIGVGVADICGYCLSTTNPFIEKLLSDNDTEPWQSFLALLETMECMVHRRKPTVRIRLRSSQNVDRHLGLCLPLLPYYHDLCVISYSLANTTDASYLACLQKQLDEIQANVEAWQPFHPAHFVDRFQTADVVNLLAQARVYRLGGLLLSHRLRHVFGQQDSQAGIWAKEIMMELDLARQVTKRSIRCVTLPFIVAAIEIRDPTVRTKALQDVDKYVDQFSPVVQKAAKTFLSRIWRERDFKITSSWFDSVHKPCAVLHYIETACVS
ncbi:hypothetical protein G7Y89_g8026 [Cudoniella acicularis]|uniref:Zn(2)-C6 fungal-type domain-containing protein n=1 Tax=Cudoniella acicularis TaxID=354080 RepID=A0A8H4W1H1_9HELO|nr:hypothetical protein G7Y89_g8026 [Cudoniella acicularis]